MNNYKLSFPTAATLLKRRSSLFKPSFEDNDLLKRGVLNFLESHHERNVPITWQRLSSGYRIVDFEINRIEEIIDFLKKYYFCTNQSCASSSLYIDMYSIKEYQEFILKVISDRNSFCALEEGTGKLIGVALASINNAFDDSMDEELDFKQRSDIFDVMKFQKALLYEANIYDRYGVEKYFCIHAICVSPDAYNIGIGSALVRSCLSKARKIGYSVCIGVFPAGPGQTIAQRFDFEILADLPWMSIRSSKGSYGRRHSSLNHTIVENSFVSCMGILVPLEKEANVSEDEVGNVDI